MGLGSKERQRNGIFGVLPAKNGARAKKRKEGEGKEGRKEGEDSFVPLPHSPLSFFGSRPIFRAGKTPKIPFLGLSLLPNPKETLATQA